MRIEETKHCLKEYTINYLDLILIFLLLVFISAMYIPTTVCKKRLYLTENRCENRLVGALLLICHLYTQVNVSLRVSFFHPLLILLLLIFVLLLWLLMLLPKKLDYVIYYRIRLNLEFEKDEKQGIFLIKVFPLLLSKTEICYILFRQIDTLLS